MSDPQRLAFIDLDGTLYRWSLYVELIEQLMRFQKALPAYFLASQAQRRNWEERAIHDDAYLSQYIHQWEERAITGLTDNELVLASHEVLRKHKNRTYIFTRELVTVLKERGYHLVAFGGSPKLIVQELSKDWKFDEWFGADYVLDQRRVFAHDQSKAKRMEGEKFELTRGLLKNGALRDGSIAIGDTLSDWPILKQVEYPILFNPEQTLYLKARQTGMPVVWERKSVVTAYRTNPEAIGARPDAFLFHEIPWSDLFPKDVAEPLTKRLRALDQVPAPG